MKNTTLEKAAGFFRLIYLKLVRMNDSPHKIAVGFGLGVFAGIMPFAGPLVALFLAMLFRVNKASAVLGGILSNTWVTVIAFLFAIKAGSAIFGINSEIIRSRWTALLKDFHLSSLFKTSALEIILPVLTGYLVIALLSALGAYLMIILVMKFIKYRKTKKAHP
ncbi:MAG: DUF2062 domain-containing protein [Candidatus Omnitrophota bacterium]